MISEITIAGAGTGNLIHLTSEVKNAINNSDVILSSPRFRNLIPCGKIIIDLKNFNDAFNILDELAGKILVLVSGDPGIFSLMPVIKSRYPDAKLTILPGISSLQVLCSYAQESWSDAVILSGHGRDLRPGKFLNIVERNRITILFCDRKISPEWACNNLSCMNDLDVYIGSSIGSPEELFIHGRPEELIYHSFPELSIILVRNNSIYTPEHICLRDSDFIRADKITMTTEAVRRVILGRLNLKCDSVFWDIGAGTGSISVSAAHENIYSEIHAIERKPEAVNVISLNASKFHLHNIIIHESRALRVIHELPEPSCVFIGGTDGELTGIIEYISRMNNPVRLVIACVTLETMNAAYTLIRDMKNFEAVNISSASSKSLSSGLTLMSSHNPVMIFSADTK